jgi:iron complex outermembrane receptor protein
MSAYGGARRGIASGFISVLLTGTALALVPATVRAQESVETAQAATRYQFNIPAGPLASALAQFGQQSGRQVTANTDSIRSASTAGVQGNLTVEEAMQRLLTGTGATYSIGAGSVISVQRVGPTGSNALTLDPVQVQGNIVPAQAEIGNLTPTYAGGEVARGGRVGVLGNRDYMDTPFSTTTYTEKFIKDTQARSIIDVLVDDPSIRASYGQSAYDDRMYVRGFALTSQDMAFNGLYGVTGIVAVPLAGIERVEVFRGPSAMLSGMAPRGAVGGTINFVPKRAPDAGITQATALYSSNANFGGHIDVGRRFGADKELGVRGNAYYTGGPTNVNNQADQLINLTLGVDYRSPQTRLDFDIGYLQRTVSGGQPGAFVRAGLLVPAAPNTAANFYQPWEFLTTSAGYGDLRLEHDFADNLTGFIKAGGNNQNFASLWAYPTIQNTSGGTTATPSKFVSWYQNASFEAGARGRFETGGLKHEAVVSGSYLINWTGAISQNAPPVVASNIYAPIAQPVPNLTGFAQGAPLTSQSVLSSIGLIDAISAFGDKVQLIGGVRLQQIQVANWNALTGLPTPGYAQSAVTPTVSLIVKPWSYLSFYGNYIQALEQGPTAAAGLANAGTVFAPFTSTQFEVGTKLDLGDFGATLSLFQITKPSSYVNATTNTLVVQGQQVNSGIEFTMFGEPIKGLRPLGGFLAMSPVLTSTLNGTNNGHYAPGVSQFQANLGVDWDTPWVRGLTVGGRVIYTSQAFLDPANLQSVPAWTRFDLSAKYVFERADGKPIAIRGQVTNVGNNNYWMAVPGYLTQGAPRTFMLSLTADF